MKLISHYWSDKKWCVDLDKKTYKWRGHWISSAINTTDGYIVVAYRLEFPDRSGKIRNLFKVTKDGDVLWSLQASLPEVPADQYDYFTRLAVHDESQNLFAAYTGSGYKLVVDATTGEIKSTVKDHIYRFLEVKHSLELKFRDLSGFNEGAVILDDQSVLEFPGKRAREAIEVDDGIIVFFDEKFGFPVYQEGTALRAAFKEAEVKCLEPPVIRPDFPNAVANVVKVKRDGTTIHEFLPPAGNGWGVNEWQQFYAGEASNEVTLYFRCSFQCDVIVFDVYTYEILRRYLV